MCKAALVTIAKTSKPRGPPKDEWINETSSTRTSGYYLVIKRKEIFLRGMNPGNTMLCERRQKATQRMIPCIRNVQNGHIHEDRQYIINGHPGGGGGSRGRGRQRKSVEEGMTLNG